jgi:PilZ domain
MRPAQVVFDESQVFLHRRQCRVRYSRPGSAQTLSGILPDPPVVRGGRSRRMATPSSDDVPVSADRISPRHTFETRIWIRLQRDGKKLSLQGWSRDLSESGLGAFVAEALIMSESVTLEIPLPDCDKQVIPAKVVRALGTEYGFQFTALSAEQRRQIRAALKERPAIPRHGAGQ